MASAPSSASAAPAAAPAESFEFPAFRSEEWIKAEFESLRAPAAVLEDQALMPGTMTEFPAVNLYPGKVAQVQEQIRTALFRQALFKVQNVEVTTAEECREPRVLRRVLRQPLGFAPTAAVGRALDWWSSPSDVQVMREELWTVDRCGTEADYHVRYFKEGGDGFSASVVPAGLADMWRSLKYYYLS